MDDISEALRKPVIIKISKSHGHAGSKYLPRYMDFFSFHLIQRWTRSGCTYAWDSPMYPLWVHLCILHTEKCSLIINNICISSITLKCIVSCFGQIVVHRANVNLGILIIDIDK